MLKKILGLVTAVILAASGLSLGTPAANAEECTPGQEYQSNKYGGVSVSVGVSCSGGSSGGGVSGGCRDSGGGVVPCVVEGFVWVSGEGLWCRREERVPAWLEPRLVADRQGWFMCRNEHREVVKFMIWDVPDTNTDVEGLARDAVASIRLTPGIVGVGAWTDEEFPQFGVSWWVGAPLWLWIDGDDTVWGTHQVTATRGGVSVTATVRAVQSVYTMGDGTLVVCDSRGQPRVYDPDDLLDTVSPAGCDHRYTDINTAGDPTSHYTVTASVTWHVTWTATTGTTGTYTITIPTTNTPTIHIGELHTTRQ